MKTMRGFGALWLSGALACALGAPARAQQLISNGGFESGLASWTVLNQVGSGGTFTAQSGTTTPINGFTVPAPPEGTQAALTDADSGGSHVLYQDFVVPTGIGGGSVGFSLFVNNGDTTFRTPATLDWATPTPNQQARVDLLTATSDPFSVAAGDVLLSLYRTNAGDPLVSGYTSFSANITPLLLANQGQTLRLRFAEVDNASFFNLGVDRVFVQATVPEPSSVALLMAGGGLLGLARSRRRRA